MCVCVCVKDVRPGKDERKPEINTFLLKVQQDGDRREQGGQKKQLLKDRREVRPFEVSCFFYFLLFSLPHFSLLTYTISINLRKVKCYCQVS